MLILQIAISTAVSGASIGKIARLNLSLLSLIIQVLLLYTLTPASSARPPTRENWIGQCEILAFRQSKIGLVGLLMFPRGTRVPVGLCRLLSATFNGKKKKTERNACFCLTLRPCSALNYKKKCHFRENGFKAVSKKWCFSEKMVFGIYIKMAFFRVSFIFFSSLY